MHTDAAATALLAHAWLPPVLTRRRRHAKADSDGASSDGGAECARRPVQRLSRGRGHPAGRPRQVEVARSDAEVSALARLQDFELAASKLNSFWVEWVSVVSVVDERLHSRLSSYTPRTATVNHCQLWMRAATFSYSCSSCPSSPAAPSLQLARRRPVPRRPAHGARRGAGTSTRALPFIPAHAPPARGRRAPCRLRNARQHACAHAHTRRACVYMHRPQSRGVPLLYLYWLPYTAPSNLWC